MRSPVLLWALLSAPSLLLSPPRAAMAQPEVAAEASRTVSVTGTGEVEVPPGRATLSLAVEVQAKTADAAAKEVARRVDAVTRAVRGAGIPGEAVRTVQFELGPEYRPEPPGPGGDGRQRLLGYRGLQVLEVDVADLARLGAVIDAGVGAGANRVADLRLEPKDPAAARREALRRAVADARAEAEAIAGAAGERLGPPLHLATPGPVVPFARADVALSQTAEARAEPGTQVPTGPLKVGATVNAVFRLQGAR